MTSPISDSMDSGTDPHKTVSIRDVARDCATCFEQLLQSEDNRTRSPFTSGPFWASRQYADFNLWWTKVGMSQTGLRSVDVRLKDVPEINTMLLRLLRALHHDLNRLINSPEDPLESTIGGAGAGPDRVSQEILEKLETLSSSDESENSDVERTAIQKSDANDAIWQHIGQTLDRLQGYAKRIEQAGAEHRQKRLDTYRRKQRTKQAYEGFRRIGEMRAKAHFRKAPAYILSRIADSFARRRTRFEYIREHQRKREAKVFIVSEPGIIVKHLNKQSELRTKPVRSTTTPSARNIQRKLRPHDQQTILSQTVDTEYRMGSRLMKVRRAESVRSVTLEHPGFPKPPLAQDGIFCCPYCSLHFHEQELEVHRWRSPFSSSSSSAS
ncbi:hypothetical protein FB567DRAFT_518742 [Paraphoma chrysanthemicola]|uniref:C2H2-type domain-containing protein n=1 Tax=Paraphoma chrysanthemicola TaxID=798071 RepID=A0A8K0W262_9PLEO|nr:hypothetical protein FB567DRAFT_518742 [Paraphoma chrysanthemicola]